MRKANLPDLYNLLDTLVALRIELEEQSGNCETMQVFSGPKVQELRSLLDAAIGSTNHLIEQKRDRESFYPAYARRWGTAPS